MSTIKNDDLFVVQCQTDDATYNYTGEQLKNDIQEFVADKDIKIWFNSNSPPVFGEPDYAGPYDFWFDVSLTTLFVAQKTTMPDVMSWVMANPGDKTKFLDAVNNDVEFPVGTTHGEPFQNPNTDVTYYFRAQRNQWVDTDGGMHPDEFVSVFGDTMTGALVMDNASIHVNELVGLTDIKDIEYIKLTPTTGPADDPFVKIEALSPSGWTDNDGAFGLRIDVGSQGASEYGQFIVSNDADDVFVVQADGQVTATAKITGTKLQLNKGILLKSTGDPQFIRAYNPADDRILKLFYDSSDITTKLHVENQPLLVVGTDGTGTDFHVWSKYGIDADGSVPTDRAGNFCSIKKLIDPVEDEDAVNLKTLNSSIAPIVDRLDTVDGAFLPISGGTLTGAVDIDSGDLRVLGALKIKATSQQIGGNNAVFLSDSSAVINNTLELSSSANQKVNFLGTGNCDIAKEGNWYVSLQDIIVLNRDIDMRGRKLTKLPTPSAADDAATKKYVDDNTGGGGPFVQAGTAGIKITKTGNTYYIEGG